MPTKPEPLSIRLTRLSPTHHRFEAVRPDGRVEMRELETRTFLLHDLVHFALESEAGLRNSFFGLLGNRGGYDDLGAPTEGEALATERVVGPLQNALKGQVEPETFARQLSAYFRDLGEIPPEWLNAAVIAGAVKRFNAMQGRWKATRFGETMELLFPPEL